jgi:thiol:disulfide interchange protein
MSNSIFRRIFHIFNFATILLSTNNLSAQVELGDSKVKWKFSVESNGSEAIIIAKITSAAHWHVNAANIPKGSFSIPTVFSFQSSPHFEVIGGIIEPKPVFLHDDLIDEDLYFHEGTVIMKRKIKILTNKDFVLKGNYGFQTCNESICLPYYEHDFSIDVKVPAVLDGSSTTVDEAAVRDAGNETVQAVKSTQTPEKSPLKGVEKKKKDKVIGGVKPSNNNSLWGIFFLAFFSGFAALIMPCVFPMIPMTVSFFTKQSKTRAHGIKNAFIYGGSIVLIHVLLGAIVVATGAGQLLNELSTNLYFNLFFFLMLFLFGLSFLGAFEIQMPNSWVNKADAKADKGGVVGIFFMALVLSLASFSCTGPILGALLGGLSSYGGGTALMVGMLAFGLALALPFMLFSIFPSWMNSMPNSGGWLNVVKVFLGFIEIAFAFKFLSTADTTMQWHLLEREIFIAIWIAVFGTLALYLYGKIRLPHDSIVDKLSVGRTMIATLTLAFTIYLIPGLWGAPLKLVNAFLPPDFYAESPKGFGGGGANIVSTSLESHAIEGMHEGPQGLMAFNDYDKALAYAREVGKPLFVDFTGWGCVNCRKMEQSVWGEPGVIEHLRNDFVIVSLYVDERTELPKSEQKTEKVDGRDFKIVTVGNKWTAKQIKEYQIASQPYYVLQTPDGEDIPVGSADFQNHSDSKVFLKWLDRGLAAFQKD